MCMAGSSFALEVNECVYTPQGRYKITGANVASSNFVSFDGWTVVTASEQAIDANFSLVQDGDIWCAQSLSATAGEGMSFKFVPSSADGVYVVSYKMKSDEQTSIRVKTDVLQTNLVTITGVGEGIDPIVVNKAEHVTQDWQTFNYAIVGDGTARTYTISFTGMATNIKIADLQIAPAAQIADLRQRDLMLEKMKAYRDVYDWPADVLDEVGYNETIENLQSVNDETSQADLDDMLATANEILYGEGGFLATNMEDYLARNSWNKFDYWPGKKQKQSTWGDWNVLPSGRGFWENESQGYPDLGHYAGSQKWGDMTMGVTLQKDLSAGSYVFMIDGKAAFRENASSSTWANNDGLKMSIANAYIVKVPESGTPTAADTIKSVYQELDPWDFTTAIVAVKIAEDGKYEIGYKVVVKPEFVGTTAGGVTYIHNASLYGKNDNKYTQAELAYEADVREQITAGRNNLTTAAGYLADANKFWGKTELQACVDTIEVKIANYELLDQDAIIATFDADSYNKANSTKNAEEGLLVFEVYDTAVKDILAANRKFVAVNDTLESLQVAIDAAEATLKLRVYDAATGKGELMTAIGDAKDCLNSMRKLDYDETNAFIIVSTVLDLNEAVEAFKASVPASEITEIINLDFSNAATQNAETGLYEVAGTNTVMSFSIFSETTPSDAYPFELGFDSNGEKLLSDVLRVGNGTGEATIPANDYGTNILKVSMDWWFGRLSGRKAGFSLLDENGDRVAGWYFEPYDASIAANYDDFVLDNQAKYFSANTAGDAAACADNNKTHIEIILDYGEKSMYLSSTIPSGTTTSEKVAFNCLVPVKFIVQSGYNYAPGRRCWFDNLKIEKVTASATEPFVPDGIEEIANPETEVKAPVKYFKNGRIVINGKYGINGVLIK